MNYDAWKMAEPPEYSFDLRDDEGREDEPEAFVRAPKGTVPNGCSLRRFLPTSLTRKDMDKAFGRPHADAYWEPERGYDGYEWVFVLGQGDADVRFTVYARWGCFRVGANVDSDAAVDDFIGWLGEKVNLVLRPS